MSNGLMKGEPITTTSFRMKPVKVTDDGFLFAADADGQLLVGSDGTSQLALTTDSSGQLKVVQANLLAGEDPVNDYRKVKKDDLGVYTPAGTLATAVTASLTTVIASTEMTGYPNFTVYVVNAGGGSADALDEVQVQVSPDGATFKSIDTDAALALAATGMNVQVFVGQSARYVRVQAKCGAGDDTTVDAYITANRG